MSLKLHQVLAKRNEEFFNSFEVSDLEEIGYSVLHVRENMGSVAHGKLRALLGYLENGRFDKDISTGLAVLPSKNGVLLNRVQTILNHLESVWNISIHDHGIMGERYTHYMMTGEELNGTVSTFSTNTDQDKYKDVKSEDLSIMLREAVDKGEPVLVSQLALAIASRGERIQKESVKSQVAKIDTAKVMASNTAKRECQKAFDRIISLCEKGILYDTWAIRAANSPSKVAKALANVYTYVDMAPAVRSLDEKGVHEKINEAIAYLEKACNLQVSYVISRLEEKQSARPDWEKLYEEKCDELEAYQATAGSVSEANYQQARFFLSVLDSTATSYRALLKQSKTATIPEKVKSQIIESAVETQISDVARLSQAAKDLLRNLNVEIKPTKQSPAIYNYVESSEQGKWREYFKKVMGRDYDQ